MTKEYKKTTRHQEELITKMDKKLAKSLDIDDRVEVMPKTEAYITFKDHITNLIFRTSRLSGL